MPDAADPVPAGYVTTPRDRLASARGVNFGVAIMAFIAMDALVLVAVLAALQPAALPIAVGVGLTAPLALLWLITQILWAPIARRHPARPQAPDAVVRLYQSLAFSGARRINNFVHIAADADHLHCIAPGIMRITGAKVISIPWDRLTEVRSKGRFGMTTARLDGRYFAAPTWCMQVALAQNAPEAATPPEASVS